MLILTAKRRGQQANSARLSKNLGVVAAATSPSAYPQLLLRQHSMRGHVNKRCLPKHTRRIPLEESGVSSPGTKEHQVRFGRNTKVSYRPHAQRTGIRNPGHVSIILWRDSSAVNIQIPEFETTSGKRASVGNPICYPGEICLALLYRDWNATQRHTWEHS